MSRVFKAIDLRRAEAGASDTHVAVKVLTEPFNEYFGSIVALQREAHKLQNLTHPNIVRVIDCDRDGRTVFMTMEYLPGGSLQKILRTSEPGGMAPAAALKLLASVGDALEYALRTTHRARRSQARQHHRHGTPAGSRSSISAWPNS